MPEVVTIRPAAAGDIPALLALDAVAATNLERREEIEAWVAAGQCHVAVEAGQPIGYLALTRGFFRSPFIEMVMVDPKARRSGTGRLLIEHAIDLTPPGEKLWTSTNSSNAPMRALLAQLGFLESGVVEGLDEGDPDIILRAPVVPRNAP